MLYVVISSCFGSYFDISMQNCHINLAIGVRPRYETSDENINGFSDTWDLSSLELSSSQELTQWTAGLR